MTDEQRKDEDEGRHAPRPTYIPKPPSKAELERISRDQALITDEWTGDPPADPPDKDRPAR